MAQKANARKKVTTVSATDATVETFIGNQLISKSRTTLAANPSGPRTTSGQWDGCASHNTTTSYYADTAPAPSTGRIAWVENVDGTATTHTSASVAGSSYMSLYLLVGELIQY